MYTPNRKKKSGEITFAKKDETAINSGFLAATSHAIEQLLRMFSFFSPFLSLKVSLTFFLSAFD